MGKTGGGEGIWEHYVILFKIKTFFLKQAPVLHTALLLRMQGARSQRRSSPKLELEWNQHACSLGSIPGPLVLAVFPS